MPDFGADYEYKKSMSATTLTYDTYLPHIRNNIMIAAWELDDGMTIASITNQ